MGEIKFNPTRSYCAVVEVSLQRCCNTLLHTIVQYTLNLKDLLSSEIWESIFLFRNRVSNRFSSLKVCSCYASFFLGESRCVHVMPTKEEVENNYSYTLLQIL